MQCPWGGDAATLGQHSPTQSHPGSPWLRSSPQHRPLKPQFKWQLHWSWERMKMVRMLPTCIAWGKNCFCAALSLSYQINSTCRLHISTPWPHWRARDVVQSHPLHIGILRFFPWHLMVPEHWRGRTQISNQKNFWKISKGLNNSILPIVLFFRKVIRK